MSAAPDRDAAWAPLWGAASAVLTAGDLRAWVAPAQGGRIAGLGRETATGFVHWLVPMASGSFDPDSWPKAGCYPLVPYSNRIRDGRFTAGGREIRLRLHPGTPDALHGFTQQRPWRLEAQGEASLTMVHDHAADAWPWAFRAEQDLALDPGGLTVRVRVVNRADTPMPVGLGLHPYFIADPSTRIAFATDEDWAIDSRFIATERRSLPVSDRHWDAPVGVDGLTAYRSGWDGRATLTRADGVSLTLTAEGLDHLVFHVPSGGDYACIEPVSHVADAVNLAAAGVAGTGLTWIAPGGEAEASVRIGAASEERPAGRPQRA